MAVKCSEGITCQYCFYSLLNSVPLFLLFCDSQSQEKQVNVSSDAALCVYVCVCTSLYTSVDSYVCLWVSLSAMWLFSTFVCICVSQSNILREKMVNMWLWVWFLFPFLIQRVMDFICLRPSCHNQEEFVAYINFSFDSLFHFTIWKVVCSLFSQDLFWIVDCSSVLISTVGTYTHSDTQIL